MKKNIQKLDTVAVLDHWDKNGDGIIQKEELTQAASKFASLQKDNYRLKWIVLACVVGMFLMVGLMIASVVIGVQISKDVKLDNNQMISKAGVPIITESATYSAQINISTPFEVLSSIQSLDIPLDYNGIPSNFNLKISAFLLIPGDRIVFWGGNIQFEINANGERKFSKQDVDGFVANYKLTSSQSNQNAFMSNSYTNKGVKFTLGK